jgi:YD repeat-containing protein
MRIQSGRGARQRPRGVPHLRGSPRDLFTAGGALTADPTRTYAYDAFGRLTGTTLGATTTTYALDGAGHRIAETTAAVTTAFDLDLRGELATILSDGTRKYLPGDPSAGFETSGTWSSPLTDLVGSAHSYVSDSGIQGTITRWGSVRWPTPGQYRPSRDRLRW